MAATSQSLTPEQRQQRRVRQRPWWIDTLVELLVYTALLCLGLVFVLYSWIFGAGWTVRGAILMWDQALLHLSTVLEVRPAWHVVRPLSQTALIAFWSLPVLCTVSELFGLPFKRQAGRVIWLGLGLTAIWLLINGLDLASTVVGFYDPTAKPTTLGGWFHGSMIGTGIASVWFTFGPEAFGTLIVVGWWAQVQRLRRR